MATHLQTAHLKAPASTAARGCFCPHGHEHRPTYLWRCRQAQRQRQLFGFPRRLWIRLKRRRAQFCRDYSTSTKRADLVSTPQDIQQRQQCCFSFVSVKFLRERRQKRRTMESIQQQASDCSGISCSKLPRRRTRPRYGRRNGLAQLCQQLQISENWPLVHVFRYPTRPRTAGSIPWNVGRFIPDKLSSQNCCPPF